MNQQTMMIIVGTLHDLATAAWIGGMLALALVVIPAARKSLGMGPQTAQLLTNIQNRLSVVSGISVAILLVTGLLLRRRAVTMGGVDASGTYGAVLAVKHALSAVMVVIAVVRSRLVAANSMKLKGGLLVLNIVLGAAVLGLSSWIAAIASAVG